MSSNEESKKEKAERLEALRALTFQFAEYAAPSTEWDHDHCEGCWAKFASFNVPDILHSGYFAFVDNGDDPAIETEIIQQARESGRKAMAKPDDRIWVSH
jgi:hypothetical protein